jgi:hypothetical protein
MAGDCSGRGERPAEPAGAPCRCFNGLWAREADCALDGLSLAAWPHGRGRLEAVVAAVVLAFLLCALHFGARLRESLRLQRVECAPPSHLKAQVQAQAQAQHHVKQPRAKRRLDAKVWLNALGLTACLVKSGTLCCGNWRLGLLFFESCSEPASSALNVTEMVLLSGAHNIACFVQLDLLLSLDNPFRRRLDPVKAVLVVIALLCAVGLAPTLIVRDDSIFSIVFMIACAANLVFVYVYSKALAVALARVADLTSEGLDRTLHVDRQTIRRIKLYRTIMVPTLLAAIASQLLDWLISFNDVHTMWFFAFINWTVLTSLLEFISIVAIFLSTQGANTKRPVVTPSLGARKGGSESVLTEGVSAAP